MAEPRVSVIIPSYDCAQLVGGAIESVLAQTLDSREIIVVDDGSTDDTREALKPFLDRPGFHYLYQANTGLPGARNAGIRHARGEFIFILDADDAIPPDCLRRHVETVDREKTDWAACDVLRVEGGDKRVVESKVPSDGALDWAIENEFKFNAFFFRRAAVERAGLFDEGQRVYEDIDLYARLLRAGAPISCIHEPLYTYMIRGGSLTKEGKRLRNLGFMERFYRRHYKELAQSGNGAAARKYGELMWQMAGKYRDAGGGWRRVLACLAECARFAPRQTVRSALRKL
ncbi:MAG: glycosyltransferase family 2 protein [Candidatus Sumerlaeia bacterium]